MSDSVVLLDETFCVDLVYTILYTTCKAHQNCDFLGVPISEAAVGERKLVAGAVSPILDYKSLTSSVSDWIAQEIISGRLSAGHRLTEIELGELLGVSRSPVREALRQLSNEGLVEIIPRRGAQVARMDPRGASDVYETRLLLEPSCCRLAVGAIAENDISLLETTFRQMAPAIQDADDGRFLELNIDYHRVLVRPCPNHVLRSLVELTWSRSERYWRFLRLARVGHMRSSYGFHKRIHQAVRKGDAEAVEASVRELLEFTLQQLTENFPVGPAASTT